MLLSVVHVLFSVVECRHRHVSKINLITKKVSESFLDTLTTWEQHITTCYFVFFYLVEFAKGCKSSA
jgi:hypothetical protein